MGWQDGQVEEVAGRLNEMLLVPTEDSNGPEDLRSSGGQVLGKGACQYLGY